MLSNSKKLRTGLSAFVLLFPALLAGQEPQRNDLQPIDPKQIDLKQIDVKQILDRLDRIEQENRDLAAEVHALREQLSAAAPIVPAASAGTPDAPPLAERTAVTEQRVDELAQTKVEASQRFPIKLTGTVLFNSFLNGSASGGSQDPTTASLGRSASTGGGSLAQSLAGFLYTGPTIWGGGKVNGSLLMDFSGGTSSSLNHLLRLHTARLSIDWKNQSITVAQDKPIFSPRDPDSFAQVSVSPLTAAGNPWLWQPQIRFEQRANMGENFGLRAQVGVYQTSESTLNTSANYVTTVSSSRPALQGRLEFWHKAGSDARFEIAPGFSVSESHAAGVSIPSHLFSVDWMIRPLAKVSLTGLFYNGQNAGGFGGLRQGFVVPDDEPVIAIRTMGGWAQISYQAFSRLTFHFYAGQESYPAHDLLPAVGVTANPVLVTRNFMYSGNAMFRIAPNVFLSFETSQLRTRYLLSPTRINNHYDLALAYLF